MAVEEQVGRGIEDVGGLLHAVREGNRRAHLQQAPGASNPSRVLGRVQVPDWWARACHSCCPLTSVRLAMMASESSPPRSSGESVCAACHVSPLRTRTYRAAAERVRLPAATPERGCSTTIAVCAVRQCARAQRGPAPRMPMVWPIGPADRNTCGAAKTSASSANARHSPMRIAGSPTCVAAAPRL